MPALQVYFEKKYMMMTRIIFEGTQNFADRYDPNPMLSKSKVISVLIKDSSKV